MAYIESSVLPDIPSSSARFINSLLLAIYVLTDDIVVLPFNGLLVSVNQLMSFVSARSTQGKE
jgi:hypothetical protein